MNEKNLTKKIQEGIEECDIYESLTDLYFGILNFEVGKKHIPSSYNDFKDVDFDEAYKNIFKLYESLVRTIERIELCLHDVHMAAESQQDLQFLLSYYNERKEKTLTIMNLPIKPYKERFFQALEKIREEETKNKEGKDKKDGS